MNSPSLESSLIDNDIQAIMTDYVSIQIDIDEAKVKAAALIAQNLDLKRIIKTEGLERVKAPKTPADENLKELIMAPWCYYTYYRCLRMFQGTFTDGGYLTETESNDKNTAIEVANDVKAVGDTMMEEAIAFLQEEDEDTEVTRDDLATNIRVFGGQENRASN